MAQLLVRGIEPLVLDRLKERAKRHHRSLQGEVKSILEEAARKMSMEEARAVAEKWQTLLAATGREFSDSTELIREDRER